MSYRSIRRILYLLLLSVFSTAFAGTVQNPVTQLQTMINDVQQSVAQDHENLQKNPAALYKIIQADVLPNMALQQMAAMTLGAKWVNATPEQKQTFIQQFSLMLTRVYAAGLLRINQFKITINPLRTNAWQTSSQLALSGIIANNDGSDPSSVTYYIIRDGDHWAVYDFAIEGVSILQNFQAQLQNFATIDAVIARLKQVNAGQV